jgi:RsiW-degrading membrane proteinase PrsW (M82 family)
MRRRTALRVGITLAVLIALGYLAEYGMANTLVAFALAAVPVPLWVALSLWLDRFEEEPSRLLVKAFAWGAIVSVFVAGMVNGIVEEATGSELASAVVSAPLIEELMKGLALLLLFWQQRDEFDNVTDGLVYAAMVGLGFAMTENVQYYGQALGDGTAAETVILRGLMSPFAHPLFTAMTGIGLGAARESRSTAVRVGAPLLGLASAVALHAAWNLSASVGLFLPVYGLLMMPAFAVVLWGARRSVRREAALVREYLAPYVATGLLSAHELDALCTTRRRVRSALGVFFTRGPRAWLRRRRFRRAAAELAFHRWRDARGLNAPGAALLEQSYAERVRSLGVAT